MFRAVIFLIVLTVAAGSNASRLCHEWCSAEVATHECRHADSDQSPALSTGDCCAGVEASVPATLSNDLLTKVLPLTAQAFSGHAGLSHHRSTVGHLSAPRRLRPCDPVPLSTVLRI